MGGPELIDSVLKTIVECWPDELEEGTKNYYITGLASFLKKFDGEFDMNRFRRRLREVGPFAVQQKAAAMGQIMSGGGGRIDNMRRAYAAIYNYRIQNEEKRLPI
jgi:hypothetical protein